MPSAVCIFQCFVYVIDAIDVAMPVTHAQDAGCIFRCFADVIDVIDVIMPQMRPLLYAPSNVSLMSLMLLM